MSGGRPAREDDLPRPPPFRRLVQLVTMPGVAYPSEGFVLGLASDGTVWCGTITTDTQPHGLVWSRLPNVPSVDPHPIPEFLRRAARYGKAHAPPDPFARHKAWRTVWERIRSI